MKGIKNECQLMERYDGHGGGVGGGEVLVRDVRLPSGR